MRAERFSATVSSTAPFANTMLRVLEHNGSTISGDDRGVADGRGAEVEEWLLVRQR